MCSRTSSIHTLRASGTIHSSLPRGRLFLGGLSSLGLSLSRHGSLGRSLSRGSGLSLGRRADHLTLAPSHPAYQRGYSRCHRRAPSDPIIDLLQVDPELEDRKSTRLNSSHVAI